MQTAHPRRQDKRKKISCGSCLSLRIQTASTIHMPAARRGNACYFQLANILPHMHLTLTTHPAPSVYTNRTWRSHLSWRSYVPAGFTLCFPLKCMLLKQLRRNRIALAGIAQLMWPSAHTCVLHTAASITCASECTSEPHVSGWINYSGSRGSSDSRRPGQQNANQMAWMVPGTQPRSVRRIFSVVWLQQLMW